MSLVRQGVERAPTLCRKLLGERFSDILVGAAMPHVNVHNLAFVKAKPPRPPLYSNLLRRCLETTALALSKCQSAAKGIVQVRMLR